MLLHNTPVIVQQVGQIINQQEHRSSVIFPEYRYPHIYAKVELPPPGSGISIAFYTRLQNIVSEMQERRETIRRNGAVESETVRTAGICSSIERDNRWESVEEVLSPGRRKREAMFNVVVRR